MKRPGLSLAVQGDTYEESCQWHQSERSADRVRVVDHLDQHGHPDGFSAVESVAENFGQLYICGLVSYNQLRKSETAETEGQKMTASIIRTGRRNKMVFAIIAGAVAVLVFPKLLVAAVIIAAVVVVFKD